MKQRTCTGFTLAVAVAFAFALPAAASEIRKRVLGLERLPLLGRSAGEHTGAKFSLPTTSYSDPSMGLKLSLPYIDYFPEGSTHYFWFPPGSAYAYDEEEDLFYYVHGGMYWQGAGLPPGVIERPPPPPDPGPEPSPGGPTITWDDDPGVEVQLDVMGNPITDSVIDELTPITVVD